MTKLFTTTIFCIFILFNAQAQKKYLAPFLVPQWRNLNYFDLDKQYPVKVENEYRYEKEENETNEMIARWKWYWHSRITDEGNFPPADYKYTASKNYFDLYHQSNAKSGAKTISANWQNLPLQPPAGNSGAGRVDRIYLVDSAANNIWVGAPSGGLWHTTNGGSTWKMMNDSLRIIGVCGIAVHPTNHGIIYIATGDGEARQDVPSIGVYKSIDTGKTWKATGLTYTVSNNEHINRLIMDVKNPQKLFAAAQTNLMVTYDGGVSWKLVLSGDVRDVRICPNDTNIVYAAVESSGIYISTNAGASFTKSTIGLPTADIGRISIAVTPAAPNVIYAYYAKDSDKSMLGVYRSNNYGQTWVLKSTTPNVPGQQGWYDLPIGVSNKDSNMVFIGGQGTTQRSTNGGANWTAIAGSGVSGTGGDVHVDFHDIVFSDDGKKIFIGNDGGIYKGINYGSTGTYTNISHGILNTQIYKMGICQTDSAIQMYGAQDNDINVLRPGTWDGENLNADGFEVAINPLQTNVLFGASQYGNLRRSTDGGNSWSRAKPSGQGDWNTPFKMSKLDPNHLIIGYADVHLTTNAGTNYTKISNFGAPNISAIAWYPKNEDVIYIVRSNQLYQTIDGGTNWTRKNLLGISGTISDIAVSSCDSSRIWVTVSGFNNGKKVFYSDDEGFSAYNISGSLPNVPVNCVYFQDSTYDAVYIGTDIGVFVKDSIMTDWEPYNQGMPAVEVTEIEVQYASNKVYCSTYGRGMWKANTYPFAKRKCTCSCDNSTIGINRFNNLEGLTLFPNPASTSIVFRNTSPVKYNRAQIFNAEGKLMTEQPLFSVEQQFDISKLTSGKYYLVISDININKVIEFIVENGK